MCADEEQMSRATRIIREKECEERTGLSRSTRNRLEREGKFPKRRKLSANAVGWLEEEIEAWLRQR